MRAHRALVALIVIIISIVIMPREGRHIWSNVQGKPRMVLFPVQFSVGNLPKKDEVIGAPWSGAHLASVYAIAWGYIPRAHKINQISAVIWDIRHNCFLFYSCGDIVNNCWHSADVFELERYVPVVSQSWILHSCPIWGDCPSMRIPPSNSCPFKENPRPFVFNQGACVGSVSRAPEFLGLRSCGFGGDSSRIGRSLGVTYAFTHKPELPQEQPRLKCGNEREDTSGGDKAQRIERNGIIRRPLPEGFEWLVLAAAAIGCVIASILALFC